MFVLPVDVLKHIAPQATASLLPDLAKYLPATLEKFQITTPLRAAHFLGQCAEESAGFRTLTEYASGREYEGRRDLGNVNAGDGVRYKGRGLIMITGRYNYKIYGTKLGIDLVNHPELAQEPHFAALIAGQYWFDHGLNVLADHDDIEHITKKINGGLNGFSDRKIYVGRAKTYLKPLFVASSAAQVAAVDQPPAADGDIVIA